MNIISFKLPKKNAVSSNAMKMLHNPTVDRKNKVAENRLSENLHELEMEYERFGASYSREKVHLKHELQVMREELEKPSHELLEMLDRNTMERLMSPSPYISRSPRPSSSTTRGHKKNNIPEITIEEVSEEKETRPRSRRPFPRSSQKERSIEQRMNNTHKRFHLQANSQKSIQEIERKHLMSRGKSSKGKKVHSS